jgi:leader peptidase (prepilin peptidase)/N-methyltransferase
MTGLLPVLAGLLGVVAGALLSRVGDRWPAPRPVPVAAGAAPAPGADAEPRSVALRVRRPVPELVTGALWALTALRFGLSWELPAFLVLAAVGVLLAVVDLRTRLLPDRLVLPALGAGGVLLAVAAVGGADLAALGRALAGAGVLFAGYLVLALVAPAGLGMGDVKLAALLGLHLAWLGWPVLVNGALAGFVVQAVLAAVLLAGRRVALRGYIPFGPAMLAGAALGIALIR